MDLNKAFVIGRMTADPQLRTTPSGQPVTTFGVATNRRWKDKSGASQEETEFHTVVAWGRQAEIATQYLKKGAMVLIEGRLRTRSWQDKQNVSHKTTEIICERLQLGPRAAGSGGAAGQGPSAPKQADVVPAAAAEEIPTVDIEDDIKMEDLPF
jgi:single-strand DNA-binding protein